jgi:hypothetical protein
MKSMKKVKITLKNAKTVTELREENEKLRFDNREISTLNSDLIDVITVLNDRIIKSEAENIRKNNALVEVKDSLEEISEHLDEAIENINKNVGEIGINPFDIDDIVDDDDDSCRDGACDCCNWCPCDDVSECESSSEEEEEFPIEGIGNTDIESVSDLVSVEYKGCEYPVFIHTDDTPESVIAWFANLSDEQREASEAFANDNGLTLDEVKNITIAAVLKSTNYNCK